jgi:hypothetical protein
MSGAGKSTYLAWLRDTHGYSFVEHDEVAGARGPVTEADADWKAMCEGRIPPLGFVIKRRGKPTAVDIAFRPSDGALTIVRELTDAGASTWWFDGDREGALANWRRRPTPVDDAFWRVQLGYVDRYWPAIAALFRSRIVRTVGPRGSTLAALEIDRLMFGQESEVKAEADAADAQ